MNTESSATNLPSARPSPHQDGPRFAHWLIEPVDTSLAEDLAGDGRLPLTLARLLVARGVRNAAEAAAFLDPALDHLSDPYCMLGMREAVARIQSAIALKEPILIYGDYDVDGTTAIVLLRTAIEMLGGTVRFHIPHRLRDGYGMQAEVLSRTAAEGVRLVISVDTGIRAYAAAEEAARLGIDLIVTDHHLPEAGKPLPLALAVLNPNQPGCGYPCKYICGAGVAFKLSQALLEARDLTRARTKILPSFLKMLVIATVADAVPLLGENRVIAHLGITQLRHPVNPGLRALMQVAQLDPSTRRLSATDIAFRLAPRINAAGRMDVASDVVELFTTRDASRARELADKLEQLNQDRRQTEADALAEIDERLQSTEYAQDACIVMDGNGWHRGVIGILASRIVERTTRPALVLTHEDGEAYGSGRSIEGFHLLNALESVHASSHGLFTRFGGHAHAVGFSLPSDRVPLLRDRLSAYAASVITREIAARKLRCHAELPLHGITPALFQALNRLQPTGMGNEDPVFVATTVTVSQPPRFMKERHTKLRLSQTSPAGVQATFDALGWDWAPRVQSMALQPGSVIDIAYRLRHNEHPEYGGLELEIVDLRPSY